MRLLRWFLRQFTAESAYRQMSRWDDGQPRPPLTWSGQSTAQMVKALKEVKR